MNSSTYFNPQFRPDYSEIDQFITTHDTTPQPTHTGWLLGDTIEGTAPPASWAGLASRPHVEEFVPPNAPHAMGVSDERMLTWPTADLNGTGSNGVAQDVDDRSSLMQMPYFRTRVLKHDRQAMKERMEVPLRDSPAYGSGISSNTWQWTGDCAGNREATNAATPYQFNDAERSLSPFSKPSDLAPKYTVNPRRQHQDHRSRVHVQKEHSRQSTTAECNQVLPKALTSYLPKLSRPSSPSQLQLTLRAMKPTVVYIRYSCDQGCRSRGICVHFSFVLGGRQAPDGLICDRCKSEGNVKAVDADRECARHVDSRVYLAEDILATRLQAERAREVLRRAISCDWEGVSGGVGSEQVGMMYTAGGQWTADLPVQNFIRKDTACDNRSGSDWPLTDNDCGQKPPEAKRPKLNNQYAVSEPNDDLQDNQDAFSLYLTNPNNGLAFDQTLAPDFSEFMKKPNGGFGSCNADGY